MGKMSVASFEEMELEKTKVSSKGDQVSDLVREGNISIDFNIYIMFLKSMHISI